MAKRCLVFISWIQDSALKTGVKQHLNVRPKRVPVTVLGVCPEVDAKSPGSAACTFLLLTRLMRRLEMVTFHLVKRM